MPAPPSHPAVQLFGRRDSRETQKALRFFKERRVLIQFMDLDVRPIAAAELRRFAERLGEGALLDADGRRYRDLGMGYLRFARGELFERLLADPALLRLPLVRCGAEVTAGSAEAAWKRWVSATPGR
jgi:arsenate reductase (glutaredoxin)